MVESKYRQRARGPRPARALGAPFRNSSAALSSPSAFSFQSDRSSMLGQTGNLSLNFADKITPYPLPSPPAPKSFERGGQRGWPVTARRFRRVSRQECLFFTPFKVTTFCAERALNILSLRRLLIEKRNAPPPPRRAGAARARGRRPYYGADDADDDAHGVGRPVHISMKRTTRMEVNFHPVFP